MADIASAGVASISHGWRASGRTEVKEAPVSPGLVLRGNIFMVLGSSTAHIFKELCFQNSSFQKNCKRHTVL